MNKLLISGMLLVVIATSIQGASADRHAGYYYPEPQSTEKYVSKTLTMRGADRSVRISFATDFTSRMLQRPYAPDFALFLKATKQRK